MKRSLIAVFIYLLIAGGVGLGDFVNNPYKGNSIAVFKAAGAGLVRPVVVGDLLAGRVGKYYNNVGG